MMQILLILSKTNFIIFFINWILICFTKIRDTDFSFAFTGRLPSNSNFDMTQDQTYFTVELAQYSVDLGKNKKLFEEL